MADGQLSRRSLLGGAALAAGGAVVGTAGPAHADPAHANRKKTADTIVVNGNVVTMDHSARPAEAVAIRNGRILAVGRNSRIGRLAGRGTEVVDAAGGTVLPGINDSHLHFGAFGVAVPPLSYNVDAATIAGLQDILRPAVAAAEPGSWVRGSGWNDNRIGKAPTRSDLDQVSTDHYIHLGDFSGHAVAVNSRVLELAGIDRDTPDPTHGVMERDATGEPTGVFRESAMGMVSQYVPEWTEEQLSAGLDSAVAAIHSLGITSLTDPGIGLEQLTRYERKYNAGELPIRLNIMMRSGSSVDQLADLLDEFGDPRVIDPYWLQAIQIKILGDGIPTAARTAWMHEPYLDGSNGTLLTAGETIEERVETLHGLIELAAGRGFQVGTHATGDATIDAVVAGYVAAMGNNWRRDDLRHYVIHADFTPPETLRTMARHDIGANMNATIKYLLGRTIEEVVGPERTDYQWPYRTALDVGVKVSSSSDAPVTPPSWLQGIAGAVLREGQFGGVAGKEERISVEEALTSYTRTPAWQDHAEDWKGTLRKGSVADICIVDGDILGADPHDLPNMSVSTTIVDGKVVYDSGSSTAKTTAATAEQLKGLSRDEARSSLNEGECCCSLSDRLLHGNGHGRGHAKH